MEQRLNQPYTFDRTVRLVITILAILAGLYFLYILRGVLLPFLVAWLIAYMLNPIVRFFQRRLRIAHSLSVVLTLTLMVGAFIGLGMVLAPLIKDELIQINQLLSNYEFSHIGEDGISVTIAEVIGKYVDFTELRGSLSKQTIAETIQYMSPALQEIFSSTVSLLVSLTVIFIIILYLIFILLDYDKINELWRFMIPPKYRQVVGRITLDVERGMNKYFRHQAIICIILAVLYAIGFQIIGLPLAIIFGIVVGLVHMVPYLQVITFPPAILLCWLRASQTGDSFWSLLGLVVVVYIAVQCVMDLFLVPKIMGKAMGLNPAVILLSLSIWGSLFGIVGMIIAIPMTTLLLSYYKEFISSYEKKAEELAHVADSPPEDEDVELKE